MAQLSTVLRRKPVTLPDGSGPALQVRLRFEQLLADLSATFVNLPPEQIDGTIDDSLAKLVNFLDNDRVAFAEFSDDRRELRTTHFFTAPGVEPPPQKVSDD